ncbi:MAG: T9SS type A sorting domain-containing protein [Paludibacter sp.]|nr:T9SS type A sorting domain-containing protein [Paludibacter sp.]
MKKITLLSYCLRRFKTLSVFMIILLSCFGFKANAVTHQYAVSDVVALNTDLKAGTYDVYELTTPGGLYVFNTGSTSNNNTLTKSVTVKAAANLIAKPVISLFSSTSGSTANIFYTLTPNITLTLDGLEFNGINSGGTGQPLLFYGAATASLSKVIINNCYIHDFLNGSGNGVIRFDGVNGTNSGSAIDIQGSTISNFGGRAIYFANAATNTPGVLVNLRNTTFRNNSLLASRANIIYSAQINTGTTIIDHCTFYNLLTSTTSEGIIKLLSGSGAITISHCIFSNVAQTLPTATTSYCYLAGFTGTVPTGTNTFAAGTPPAFSDPTVQDFSLSNKSSFICADDGLVAGISQTALNQAKLSAPTIANATNVVGLSMTANWTPVDINATGYTVYLYAGATAPTSTSIPVISRSVTGQSTSSLLISGLTTGSTYTYKVVAIGDGVSYSNSISSGASSSFTMPKLSTPDVSAGGITPVAVGFTAQWAAVTNASSYDISVYQGATLISTTNAAGQATTSQAIIGLMSNTAYTYKVVAKGDGIYWGNSDISVASATISTVGLSSPVIGVATLQTVDGFTANWSVVTNALSYQIQLYLGNALLSSTAVPGDGTVSSFVFTGLQMGTSYTYKVIAIGDNLTPATLTSSTSVSSTVTKTLFANVNTINTNFADGTWGTPAATGSLVSGSYGSISLNGFDLTAASIYPAAVSGLKGEVLVNLISVDKLANVGSVALPTVNSLQQLEIHGFAPTAGNGFKLTEWNGSAWVAVAEAPASSYTTAATTLSSKLDSVYIFNITRATPARFRIENASSGGFILTKVITRTTAPALLPRPVINTASAISASGFTASLTDVPNALNYDVYVYQAGALVTGFPVNVTGNSNAIAGLSANTAYTYKVKAKGDGDVTYSDSYLSMPSASFTTLLATPAVQPASGVTTTGFTANWTVVAGAVSYDVTLYDATPTLVDTKNVLAPENSVAFTGLTQDATYTYYVTAKGDGSTSFNSTLSSGMTATPGTATGIKSMDSRSFVSTVGKTIRCSEAGQIQVYNVQGAKVLQVFNTNKVVTTLESGLYIVRFTGKNGQMNSTKVMIK